jgi:hypothetical protein
MMVHHLLVKKFNAEAGIVVVAAIKTREDHPHLFSID